MHRCVCVCVYLFYVLNFNQVFKHAEDKTRITKKNTNCCNNMEHCSKIFVSSISNLICDFTFLEPKYIVRLSEFQLRNSHFYLIIAYKILTALDVENWNRWKISDTVSFASGWT